MLNYILRRIGTALLVLLGAITITFFLAHAISVNPVTVWVGKQAQNSASLVAIYTKEYHLNDSLYIQYFYYIDGLLHFQLGFSPLRSEPVTLVLSQTLPYTAQLIFLAMVITVVIGIAGGILSAKFANSPLEKAIKVTYISSTAAPAFMIPLILLLLFSSFLRVFPTSGTIDPLIALPAHITGIPLLDAILEGNWTAFVSLLKHALLPSFAIAIALY